MAVRYHCSIGSLFAEIAEEHSQRPALRFLNGTTATYADLGRLSNRLAGFLKSSDRRGARVVGVLNEKTTVAYAVMLAALKSGIAYTNLDASGPTSRLGKMLDVCGAQLLFCGHAALEKARQLGRDRAVEIVCCDGASFQKSLERFPDTPPPLAGIHGDTPAYIMFTSGSTGFPKGAVITHANLLNFINWSRSTFDVSPDDVFTNVNPMHFDNSVFDFYSSLFTGASMAPAPERRLMNPRSLLDALNPIGCTIWFSVPSLLAYMLKMRALREGDLPHLRKIVFGGEGFPKAQLRRLHAVFGHRAEFVNVYGPTECTCICSSYVLKRADLESSELLPLGRIAPNFDFLVLDEVGKPLSDGEIGELYLLGPNVGAGYYGSPELTARSFVQNPLHNDYRDIVYKTGDLVRVDPESERLHFVGRKDNQIKRMGYRIELEEIETALGSLNCVHECGVVFDRSSEPGRIMAGVSADHADEIALLDDLRELLPSYMVPNQVVFLDELPKNQNGKVDRGKLLSEMGKAER